MTSRPSYAGQSLVGLSLFALILGAWATIHVYGVHFFELSLSTLPLALILALVQCWLTVGLFIVAHDAMHGSLVPFRPKVNGAIGAFILFLYAGFSWRRVREAHMAHHRHPGTEADPDFHAGDAVHFWPWYGTFFRRYFGWGSVAFVSTVVTLYILVFGASVTNVVLFYGAPAIGSSLQLFYFGTYLPHRHEEEGFEDAHNARTNDFPVLLSLLSCFHFGYHHEHHLSPSTPWWRLPGRHREMLAGQGEAAAKSAA